MRPAVQSLPFRLIVLVLLLGACTSAPAAVATTPTGGATPAAPESLAAATNAADAAQATPIPSAAAPATTVPTPTTIPMALPVMAGTPYPRPAGAISAANLSRVGLLAEYGLGGGPYQIDYNMHLSPDGQRLIVTSSAGIAVLSPDDLSVERFIPDAADDEAMLGFATAFRPIAVSRDGTLAATSFSRDLEEVAQIWDLTSGEMLGEHAMPRWETQKNSPRLARLDISPDNTLLAGVYTDGVIAVIRIPDGEPVTALAWYIDFTDTPMYLHFTRTGDLLYYVYLDVGYGEQGIQSRGLNTTTWTEETYYATKRGRGPSGYGVFSPTVSDTGFEFGYFAKAYYDGRARWGLDVFDYTTLYERYFLEMKDYPSAVNVSSDGRWLITASSVTDEIEVREAEKNQPPVFTFSGHENLVWAVAAAPDGQTFYSVGFDGVARKWHAGSLSPVAEQDGFWPATDDIEFSPDGSQLRLAAKTGSVFEIDALTGHLVRTLADAREPRRYYWNVSSFDDFFVELSRVARGPAECSISASSEVAQMAQMCDSGSLPIHLWNTTAGTLERTISDVSYTVQDKWVPRLKSGIRNSQMVLSPDGQLIAVTYQTPLESTAVRIFETSSGRLLRMIPSKRLDVMAFSPDGELLATGGSYVTQPVRILDPHTGKTVKELPLPQGSGGSDALAFTPDGALLLTLDGLTGIMRTYNTETWEEGPRLAVPDDSYLGFTTMRVSPDGSLVAFVDYTAGINFWDLESPALLDTSLRLPNLLGVSDLAFSPDGRLLAVVGSDNRIRLVGELP